MISLDIRLQPKQLECLHTMQDTPITLYGGARGGGKSYALRNIMLYRRFKYPKSVGAIFRRSYPELEANHIRPLFQEFPSLRAYWNEQKKLLTLPNGSVLQFCYCANESDVDLYQGREFHDLAIDEAGQWTEEMFRRLLGSNRSSVPNVPSRCLVTANPGNIGHQWLKRLFIDKRFNDRERAEDYKFIPALVFDNEALMKNDPDYVHRLKAEPNEVIRRAYLEGNWDVMAGAYFSELRREIHFIKSFSIPKHWFKFGSYDFGFNHPAAFGWFACDGDGNVYLYREFIQSKLRVDQYAERILRYEDTKLLDYIVAGLDCWANKGILSKGSPPTIAEEFRSHEIYLRRASIDRLQGAAQLRSYLAPRPKPRLYIMDSCPISFECLSRMQHDPDRVEDVLKIDAVDGDPHSGDDAYDMIRYAIMSRPSLAETLPLNFRPQSKEWVEFQAKRHEQLIDQQIERDKAEEREMDQMMITMMDPEDNPISYYINKRRNG